MLVDEDALASAERFLGRNECVLALEVLCKERCTDGVDAASILEYTGCVPSDRLGGAE